MRKITFAVLCNLIVVMFVLDSCTNNNDNMVDDNRESKSIEKAMPLMVTPGTVSIQNGDLIIEGGQQESINQAISKHEGAFDGSIVIKNCVIGNLIVNYDVYDLSIDSCVIDDLYAPYAQNLYFVNSSIKKLKISHEIGYMIVDNSQFDWGQFTDLNMRSFGLICHELRNLNEINSFLSRVEINELSLKLGNEAMEAILPLSIDLEKLCIISDIVDYRVAINGRVKKLIVRSEAVSKRFDLNGTGNLGSIDLSDTPFGRLQFEEKGIDYEVVDGISYFYDPYTM